jgi:hypothetical protein
MFASLLFAAAIARSWFPGVPYTDLVTCPPNHHFKAPPVSSFMPPFLPSSDPSDGHRVAQTRVSDEIDFPAGGATWFQSPAGSSGNGTFAVYDTAGGVYATCSYQDTAHELQFWRVSSQEIPSKIPRRNLDLNVRTSRGIRFGDTLGAIEAVYGGQRPYRATAALWAVRYTKTGPQVGSLPFVTITTFYLRSGRLVGIDRVSGI